MTDVNEDIAEEQNLPADKGALVVAATEDGPADDAGLRGGDPQTGEGGDLIVSVDGKAIETSDDLAAAIAGKQPGDTVEVEYYRGDDRETVEIELGERPDAASEQVAPEEEQPEEDDGGGLFPLP
jgi:S1-C subfamily serine protease